MRKLVFALAMGILTLPAFAQEGHRDMADRTPEERAQMMVRKMAEELNLSDEQIKALTPKLIEFQKEKAQEREAQKARHEEFKAELEAILTEEQMKKFEEQMKARHKRRMKHRARAEHQPESVDE